MVSKRGKRHTIEQEVLDEEVALLGSRDGALRRQNRVLIGIDGHIPSRVTEFFLTDWMNGQRIG